MPTAILPGKAFAAALTSSGSRRATAQDDAAQPLAQPVLDLVEGADAAPQLHRHLHPGEDGFDGGAVAAFAGEGTVEVDDMQILEALAFKDRRLRRRVGVEHRRLRHVAQLEAHGFAALEVDRGEQDHGAHLRKFSISFSPSVWLFSGWNCVPNILSRPTQAVTAWP